MKKNISIIIFALILVVVGPNVYADGTKGKKDKDSRKEKAEKVVNKISNTFDRQMKFENWMTEIKEFDSNETFFEEELQLENWMTDSFMVEEDMVLENWMTETIDIENNETELELEQWMLEPFVDNNRFQEEELVLEDWMLKF